MTQEQAKISITPEMINRCSVAVEGECDGLAIDDRQARVILEYILDGSATPSAPPVMAGAVTDEMVATGLAVLRNRTWNGIPQDKRIVTEILTAALSVAPGRADGRQAAQDVLAERRRQVEAENWTAEHDDQHAGGQIALAAAAYAEHSSRFADAARHGTNYATVASHPLWPWHRSWWKPKSPRADLVKAGALIIAEIERIDRAAPPALTGEKQRQPAVCDVYDCQVSNGGKRPILCLEVGTGFWKCPVCAASYGKHAQEPLDPSVHDYAE